MKNHEADDRQAAMRVVDANANRAGEGLRTLEDFARLVREDAAAVVWLKQLRHGLAESLEPLGRGERLRARSTQDDAGTDVHANRELKRDDLASIVPAACERVLQSLRSLEEFSKLLSVPAGGAFKQLRYHAYDVLAQLELRWLTGQTLTAQQQLYLLIDCSLPLDAFRSQVSRLADSGVDLLQLRDKAAEGSRLMSYARAAIDVLKDCAARLVVNDRLDVALACGAAGVHLGQDDLSLPDARHVAQGRLWIGVSTHSLAQAIEAEQGGADYIGCGPVFPSKTKNFDAFAGTEFLRQAAKNVRIPVFAIGGITSDNLEQVLEAGCQRIAVSGAIHLAVDPCQAARQLKEQLSRRTKVE
ncbi:MAG: thiamine phosphate synthase [Planctomycetales bacterium]|nr:thiamine phosphate synthase [Planctomycetales bacterium]